MLLPLIYIFLITLVHYSVVFASLAMTCMGSHVLIAG